MKIVWISSCNPVEFDVRRSSWHISDLDCIFYCTYMKEDESYLDHGNLYGQGREGIKDILDRGFAEKPDLVILKYPFFVLRYQLTNHLLELGKKTPFVVWCSEQGPTRNFAFDNASPFPRVAVNNLMDVKYYREKLPDTKIYYLPFGSASYMQDELVSHNQYKSDLLADSKCHYTCCEYKAAKKKSCDVMIVPVLDKDIALYGAVNPRHGWAGVPGAITKWRGKYFLSDVNKLYSSTKLYIGITWNWAYGGYGIKLARCLGIGVPLLWHYTIGMENEFEKGNQLDWSSTPEETIERVEYYLSHDKDRIEMGRRGKEYADHHLNWGSNLMRLVEEVRSESC